MKSKIRYSVRHEPAVSRFPWVVVDDNGDPALWQPDSKVGNSPMRFRTEAFGQAAADRLNTKQVVRRA